MSNETSVKIASPDPSAIGLFGLAIVTLVASSSKLGITEGVSLIIPWAIFLGACAQFLACIFDFKKGNVFGATAFGGFAFFWLGMAMTWMINLGVFGQFAIADSKQTGVAFIGYLIFSLYMTIGAAETNKVLFIIFCFIDLLFIGLSMSSFGILPDFSHGLAAWSELVIALLSFYGSAANVLNNHFGRVFLPVGKAFGWFKRA